MSHQLDITSVLKSLGKGVNHRLAGWLDLSRKSGFVLVISP
jgi:hypothetical protein